MNADFRIILFVLAGWLYQPAWASEPDSVLEDSASSLLAVQLASEVADELREQFVQAGKSLEAAEAITFQIVDDAADCSINRLQGSNMPQIQSYVDLLVRNEEMSIVLRALGRMYDRWELEQMQSEIARVVQECLELSKAGIGAS